MLRVTELQIPGFERVIQAENEEAKLHCLIAIHDTTIGPALGGVRMYPYIDQFDALQDALRLSKGMTYKSILAKCGFGGGKAVIIGDPAEKKTPELLRAFGEVVEFLEGNYITAEDLGICPEDLMVISETTDHVVGLPLETSSGDPSRFTAWGVYIGMQAIAMQLFGDEHLQGKRVAIQGLGNVGAKLAEILFWQGAKLTIADVDEDKARKLAKKYGAEFVTTQEVLEVDCDILSPCAIGGVIHEDLIPKLRCAAIGGSANNQLATSEDGVSLFKRGILYAPDYIINSGGLINVAAEFEPEGYDPNYARDRVNHIYDALIDIFAIAESSGISTSEAADILAEKRLKEALDTGQGL